MFLSAGGAGAGASSPFMRALNNRSLIWRKYKSVFWQSKRAVLARAIMRASGFKSVPMASMPWMLASNSDEPVPQ